MNKMLIQIPVLNRLINNDLNLNAHEWELVKHKHPQYCEPKHQRNIPNDTQFSMEWRAKVWDKTRKNILELRKTCKALYNRGILFSYTITMTRVILTFNSDDSVYEPIKNVKGKGINLLA